MANNPLSMESIVKHMAEALPTHAMDDTNSDLSSSYEAIALFAHACMTAVGFRLLGFGEGQKAEEECQSLAPRLSTKWNTHYGSHAFLYAHSQSSMQYVVKVDRLGGKAEIRGIGLGDERIARFEVTAKDYVSSAALPLRITMTADGEEDRQDLESKLKEVFISPSRIQGQH
jgi:PI31 proteasome regulator N-terminal